MIEYKGATKTAFPFWNPIWSSIIEIPLPVNENISIKIQKILIIVDSRLNWPTPEETPFIKILPKAPAIPLANPNMIAADL